jgi:hypothetical protein
MNVPLIYTDPYTGHEILTIGEGVSLFGVAYDPRRTSAPTVWHQQCPHCRGGRQRELTIHLKRMIQLLCTHRSGGFIPQHKARVDEYDVPTNTHVHVLRHWKTDGVHHAHVLDDQHEVLRASRVPLEKMTFEGDLRKFRSNMIVRGLKLLFSGRPATEAEITSTLLPLAQAQSAPKIRRGRYHFCSTVKWAPVLEGLYPTP